MKRLKFVFIIALYGKNVKAKEALAGKRGRGKSDLFNNFKYF